VSSTNKKQLFLKILFLLLFGFSIILTFSKYIPPNMDEYSLYHTLMCHYYPNNSLNVFRENCQGYDLNLLNTGLVLPLREYAYMGSLTSLIYYPLFLIWKNPDSARFLGIILLFLQAIILSKLFKSRIEYVFLGLISFFPYFFQHVVDTGDVGLQCCGVFLVLLLFKKWFMTYKTKYAALISFVIFLGVWTKLTFFFVLPGVGSIVLMQILQNKKQFLKKRVVKSALYGIIIATILLLGLLSLLFLSTSPSNSHERPYLNQIMNSKSQDLGEIINIKILQSRLFKTLLNPFEATQRIYSDVTTYTHSGSVKPPNLFVYFYDFLVYLTPFIFWIIVRHKNKQHQTLATTSLIFYFAFVLTLFLILKTENTWAMHHIVLAFPFLILSYLAIIDLLKETKIGRKVIVFGFIIFILMNCYFFFTFYHKEFPSQTDFSRIKMNGLLKNEYLANNYFYVVTDWGMYYYQALYGDKSQSVLYMEPLRDAWQVNALKELSKKHNRKILFIYNSKVMSSDHNLIENNFVLKDCSVITSQSVWKIRLEYDTDPRNICFSK